MKVGNPSFLAGAIQNPLIISSGLIGFWPCNDGSGSIVRDLCGNASFTNGVFSGSNNALPNWVNGPVGGGLYFSRSIAFVQIPDSTYLRPNAGDFSISCWFNAPPFNQAATTIISKRENAPNYIQLDIDIGYVDNSGNGIAGRMVSLFTYGGSGAGFNTWYTTNWQVDGNWHHLVVVRPASGNPSFYIDGYSVAVTNPYGLYNHNINTSAPWQFGYSNSLGVGGSYTGSVDQVRFYSRILTPSEIVVLYNEKDGQYHAQAKNWAARVVQNGGAYPSSSLLAVSDFCKGLDSAGLTSRMLAVNIFAPDNLTAAITPLFKLYGNDPWTNTGFIVSDLTVNGLKGNGNPGSGKNLDTGFIGSSVWTATNMGCCVMISQISAADTTTDVGEADNIGSGTSRRFRFAAHYSGSGYARPVQSCFQDDDNTAIVGGVTMNDYTKGNFAAVQVIGTAFNNYWGDSTVGFIDAGNKTGASGTPPQNAGLRIYTSNEGGSLSTCSPRGLSFVAITSGMTKSETQTVYNLIQTLRQTLGGGYV